MRKRESEGGREGERVQGDKGRGKESDRDRFRGKRESGERLEEQVK